MRSLKLDFLHPYQGPHWLAWPLLAGGLVMAIWVGWSNRQLDLDLAKASAQATQQRPQPSVRLSSIAAPGADITEAQSAREQLSLPWGSLFSDLEKAQSKRIALISLDADGRKNEATLTAEARNLWDMLAYIELLKSKAGFKSVILASHVMREKDPQLPVRFVLRLGWKA